MLEIITSSLPSLLSAMLKFTIPLSLISFVFGMVIAFVVALIRTLNPNLGRFGKPFWLVLKAIISFYVWAFRSTPLLVQLFIIFFGLPSVGIKLAPFIAALIGFSLNMGAYGSETIRAALLSVSEDQWEAAYTLGFSTPQTLWHFIIPQALRTALPPLSNEFIGLVKDTSLASTITIAEMFQVSQQIAAQNFEPLLMYIEVAALYAVLCSILNVLQHYLEKRSSQYLKGDSD
ncbi:amino acid ABC transporter permease [Fructilactobacillus hinvesii]|uniref:Amino acid ABC transporter permease n=1 Tax=Fructilactobacillus hinvesii TaxID=2940300 RepID=A0ABY5BQG4_9LACO|nr:amino acid ABC transporter permease [Fructilactobacillus hinvesii]USS87322.1 amino acid ABC transporter permease [Fructilactobacillus hinvesii]